MKIVNIFLIIFLAPIFLLAQNVDRYQLIKDAEYFINEDPGEGNGTPIEVDMGFTVNINLDNLPYNDGDIIFVRVKNDNGDWSAPLGRKLGNNYIDEARVFKVTYPVPNDRKLIEVKASIENKRLNGLIASAVSDPIEGDNLKPGDTLLVQFKGVNGIWGSQYEVILAKPDMQIARPLNLQAENIGGASPKVKLTWADNSESENQFSIEKSVVSGILKDVDQPLADWEEIAKVDKNTSEYIDESLEINKVYQWRVKALGIKDWMTSEYSNVVDLMVVGVEDFTEKKSNFIYPNPAKSYITISNDFSGTHYKIIDMLGNEIITGELRAYMGKKIDISGISVGMYCLVIYDNSRIIKSERFIKY